jgi:hypothetical protein
MKVEMRGVCVAGVSHPAQYLTTSDGISFFDFYTPWNHMGVENESMPVDFEDNVVASHGVYRHIWRWRGFHQRWQFIDAVAGGIDYGVDDGDDVGAISGPIRIRGLVRRGCHRAAVIADSDKVDCISFR